MKMKLYSFISFLLLSSLLVLAVWLPRSNNAFETGVTYTVERHATHDNNRLMVVISSTTDGGEKVEIWSTVPELYVLPIGSRFEFLEEGGLKMISP